MAISKVLIANLAISKIGHDSTIEALDEDSAQANVINLWFDQALTMALAAFNWSFARKRLALAAHGDSPSDDWGYRYQYPSDCVKARFIFNPTGIKEEPVPFDVEQSANGTKSILTDEASAILIYTKNVSDVSLFSPYFIQTFATVLASFIAFALTGRQKLATELEQKAQFMFLLAEALDASEKQERVPRDAPQIRGRA